MVEIPASIQVLNVVVTGVWNVYCTNCFDEMYVRSHPFQSESKIHVFTAPSVNGFVESSCLNEEMFWDGTEQCVEHAPILHVRTVG